MLSYTIFADAYLCGRSRMLSGSDSILELAIDGKSSFALVPCCHTVRKKWTPPRSAGPDATQDAIAQVCAGTKIADAVDAVRIKALIAAGFEVYL